MKSAVNGSGRLRGRVARVNNIRWPPLINVTLSAVYSLSLPVCIVTMVGVRYNPHFTLEETDLGRVIGGAPALALAQSVGMRLMVLGW